MLTRYLGDQGLYNFPLHTCTGDQGRVNKLMPPERDVSVKNQAKVNAAILVLTGGVETLNGTSELDRVRVLAKQKPLRW